MKILYGVQGTGNGHISRARAMAVELGKAGAQVDYVFSGRAPNEYFDMEIFGEFRALSGLTFATKDGRVQYLSTARKNSIRKFVSEIRSLDITPYDLVITDFEPVTAWAAKRAKHEIIGLGHQYAFNYPIPLAGDSSLTRAIMRHFAPVSLGLGLHWHHFNQPILPPIIANAFEKDESCEPNQRVLVYLPFENQFEVVKLLHLFQGTRFILFTNNHEPGTFKNVVVEPQGFPRFQTALHKCRGVICNAGFELSSEAFHLGKKLLVKPLAKQMEQLSNAAAIEELKLAGTMNKLDADTIQDWLRNGRPIRIQYTNVAKAITQWLTSGRKESPAELARRLWLECYCDERPDLFAAKPRVKETSATKSERLAV